MSGALSSPDVVLVAYQSALLGCSTQPHLIESKLYPSSFYVNRVSIPILTERPETVIEDSVSAAAGLRWGVERRLEFIEFRLYWEGRINRSDLTEFFGVSVPQASKDLSQYQELAPGNMDYDKSEKRYSASPNFQPRFLRPDPDRYLAQLRSVADDIVPLDETWLGNPPDLGAMPIPHRRVDASVLRALLRCVRDRKSVEVEYQSMNPKRAIAQWRRITPHAFGSDGLRWHVRAYCHIDNSFKDFLLSRCLKQRDIAAPGASASDDAEWQSTIEVKLIPNPKLSDEQKAVIATEFEMQDGGTTLPIRRALLYYFSRRLRIDVADLLNNPVEVPVVVENRGVFDKALAEAMSKLGV